MSLEPTLQAVLSPLVGGRAYPDTTPNGVEFPCITYQQVGGQAGWYLENNVPSHKHARVQVNVWAKSRAQANTIARQVENAICGSTLIAEPYGALSASVEEILGLYGTRQDFGVWFPDPSTN